MIDRRRNSGRVGNRTENVHVYQGGFWHCIWQDKCCLPWQAFDSYRATFWENLSSHIIRQWMKSIPVYIWGVLARKLCRKQNNRTSNHWSSGRCETSKDRRCRSWHEKQPSAFRDWAPSLICFNHIWGIVYENWLIHGPNRTEWIRSLTNLFFQFLSSSITDIFSQSIWCFWVQPVQQLLARSLFLYVPQLLSWHAS